MGSFQEHVARLTLVGLDDLIRAAQATQPERVLWRPLETGRHVLDIIQECGAVNARWAEILAQRAWVVWPVARYLDRRERLVTLDKAIEQLRQDTDLFLSQLQTLRDEDLAQVIPFPTYEATVAGCAMHPIGHMAYHEGQISYIQTLYGDWNHS